MTAAAILKLQRAGFTEEQVEALADYFDDQLATKSDLALTGEHIRSELKAAEARLQATIEEVRGEVKAAEARLLATIEEVRGEVKAAEARLNTTIEQVRGEVRAAEARLETKIEQARGDTIKWVIGIGFAQAATILAVLRLFPGHP